MGKYSRSHKINTNHPVFPHQKSPCREDGFEDRRLDRERAQKKKKKTEGWVFIQRSVKGNATTRAANINRALMDTTS
ncbi:hypothetical protein MDV085.3 [Gallid alphaherpesvirus 2]|uniref:Uncharacterized protein n=1 Tax=Gallid alphaherpesvirus 2 TaxID=10390 RepID=Q19B42_9ALPH|nr:hypothetical protein MDV085.3 [Gallid alphaherpesvirus 2]ADA83440.1 hypothetical protein [Gallid alphaherpesvirus 2]AEZ51767.1 hypothetical protein MDV085.3 [Gallid alphaherpesvirus 2]AEZ51798.1 hypothetical protein MDV098.9 [Gallid alphaherpesvirus 2]UOW61360.1 hypothetical protein MDV085.3 [Gallid alphaherpesvirus 2]